MGHRAKIINEIERAVSRLPEQPGQCLYYAHHTARILWRHGHKVVIQAGSLQWPRVRREEDDGKVRTHFAYEWNLDDPKSRAALEAGQLPELHVWTGLVDQQVLIDFSTRHLQVAARKAGLEWTALAPPRFLWCPATALPDWVVYRPNAEATIFACSCLKHLFDPAYLAPK